ncbi:MAG: PDZ domain-containing protein, partial [Myxococcota bacterium]
DEDVVFDFELPLGPIGGMGAEVVARCSGVELRDIRPGYPAEMAGLQAGDRVVAVDGWSTRHVSTREFVRMATGLPGTPVELDILRDGEPMTVRLTRERIPMSEPIPTVMSTDEAAALRKLGYLE